ncbi:MAG: sigma 54-interacting transcriptional regulator [Acidobacteriota bacterium]
MSFGAPFERLFRATPTLANALPAAERVATSDSPILILGEPGTGRSTVARAFHRASRRRDRPLVEVDPGAFPSTLFESELFGYRAGAFTGAETSVEGRVARAEGGTLVLDHVEALPLPVQPKLLRLLAERQFTPLGDRERTADVRFIAIAAPDLAERVQGGAFRQDLFYRLEVLAFELPPLRRRPQDIAPLLDVLLDDLAERFSRPVPELSERARRWMQRYRWPGNLRQVRNVLERQLIIAGSGALDPPLPDDAEDPKPRPLREVEIAEIQRALAYTRGHQGRAAELLGISRKALWEKRKRHGIP